MNNTNQTAEENAKESEMIMTNSQPELKTEPQEPNNDIPESERNAYLQTSTQPNTSETAENPEVPQFDPSSEIIEDESGDEPVENIFAVILMYLATLVNGIVYYGLSRETSLAKTNIEKARYLITSHITPETDFSLPDLYAGGHFEFETDDLVNRALELRRNTNDIARNLKANITNPESPLLEQALSALRESEMWLGIEVKNQRAK